GVVLGLTAATKYTAAALVAPCLAAIWCRPAPAAPSPGAWRWFAAAGAAVLLAGAVLTGRTALPRPAPRDPRLPHPETAGAIVPSMGIAALVVGVAFLALGAGAWRGAPWALRLARTEVLVMIATAGLAFFVATPYALVRPHAFLSDLAFNAQTR